MKTFSYMNIVLEGHIGTLVSNYYFLNLKEHLEF